MKRAPHLGSTFGNASELVTRAVKVRCGLLCGAFSLCAVLQTTALAQLAAPSQPSKPDAQHLIDTRQLEAAEKAITAAMMTAPRDADWITELAEVRLGQNRTREAVQLIESANAIAGKSATRAMLTGLAFSQAGYMERAEVPLRAAVELEPSNATAHYFLARLLYTDNRFDEAIDESKKVIELAPRFVRAYENLGLCYEGRYQRDEAEKSYLKAIDVQTTVTEKSEWPLIDLAVLMIDENRYEEARRYLNDALAINPNNTQALVQLGKVDEEKGDLQAALADYRKAIGNEQSAHQPGQAAAYYKAARLCKKLGYLDEAKHYFAAFNEVHDNHPPTMR